MGQAKTAELVRHTDIDPPGTTAMKYPGKTVAGPLFSGSYYPNEHDRGWLMASLICSKCQTEAPEGTAFCPSCGNSLATGVASPASTGSTPQIKFDATQLSQTDRIVGIATAVLFISLFLPWYSVGIAGYGGSASALSAHSYLYLTVIFSLGIIALLAVRALNLWKLPDSMPLNHDQVLLIGAGVNVLLVLLAFVFKPSGLGIVHVGWSFGAFVGLAAAVVAVVPLAMPVIRARRAK